MDVLSSLGLFLTVVGLLTMLHGALKFWTNRVSDLERLLRDQQWQIVQLGHRLKKLEEGK